MENKRRLVRVQEKADRINWEEHLTRIDLFYLINRVYRLERALRELATRAKVDPSQYNILKEAQEALNDDSDE